MRARSRSSRRRSPRSASTRASPASSSRTSSPTPRSSTARRARRGRARARGARAVHRRGDRAALRAIAERLELKPREAFQPIRVAVTGSKVSPGLFESIELLGREQSLERIRRRPGGSGLGGASGSRARWNSRQARRRKRGLGRSAARLAQRIPRSALDGSSVYHFQQETGDRSNEVRPERQKYPQSSGFSIDARARQRSGASIRRSNGRMP